jgi:hypothetical protein
MNKGARISSDQWHLIARHLSVVDLCRLMQVSKDWFHLWIADRAWAHQRRRICDRFPNLKSVFDLYCEGAAANEHTSKRTQKSNSNKKRKTAWITPKKGIWYVFKRWLMQGTSMKGIKELLKSKEDIVLSVIKNTLPFQELITKSYVKQTEGPLHTLTFYWGEDVFFSVDVTRGSKMFKFYQFYCKSKGPREWYFKDDLYYHRDPLSAWKLFLCERPGGELFRWTNLFEKLIKDGGR